MRAGHLAKRESFLLLNKGHGWREAAQPETGGIRAGGGKPFRRRFG